MWTVYRHTSPSGKAYIGVTSTKPKYRWSGGKGYRSCSAFNNAINKYGWDNIKHEVLKDNLSKEEAFAYEKELIAYYKSLNISYNIAAGGQGIIGVPKSKAQIEHITSLWKNKQIPEVVRQKMSKSRQGIKLSTDTKDKIRKALLGNKRGNKTVYQYTIDGTLLHVYNSCVEASNSLGYRSNEISSCCRGIRLTSRGYIFLYNQDVQNRIDVIKHNKNMNRICNMSNNLK